MKIRAVYGMQTYVNRQVSVAHESKLECINKSGMFSTLTDVKDDVIAGDHPTPAFIDLLIDDLIQFVNSVFPDINHHTPPLLRY